MPDPLTTMHEAARLAVLIRTEVRPMAERYLQQEMVDFLGRTNSCMSEIEDVLDEHPESDVIDRNQAEQLHSAWCDLAAMALAQAAILINQHPFLAEQDAEAAQ